MICRKMQHRIVNLNMQNIQVFAKNAHDQQKKNRDQKKWQNIKMQYRLCILPFLEVTILFNLHVIIVGNTVGKSPTGILTPLI